MSYKRPAAAYVNNSDPKVDADMMNSLVVSNENAILDTGQALNTSDQTQTSRTMSHYAANGASYTESGGSVANSYVVQPINNGTGTNKAPEALLDGMEVRFTTIHTNTLTSTLNVAGLGAKIIKTEDGVTELPAGSVSAFRLTIVHYNKSNDVWILFVSGGTGGTITRAIAQDAHGFNVGDVLRKLSGIDTGYVLAIADSPLNAEVAGIVSGTSGLDNFVLDVGGFIPGLTGLAAGVTFFLSPTVAGTLTSNPPTGVGQVSKPILIGDSTTSGYFFNMRGQEILDVEQDVLRKNLIINPLFELKQRAGATTSTNDVYLFDRWLTTGGDGSYTLSRQAFTLGQTDVPGEPRFFLRHDQSGAATSVNPLDEQRIEDVRVTAGRKVTLSFFAKANTAITVTPRFTQSFGTGGTPSADVDTDGGTLNITTAWQEFTVTVDIPSISGKTLGTDTPENNYLGFKFVHPTGITFIFDFTRIQVEKNPIKTEFEERSFAQEIELAQRYYQKSYDIDVDPGTITTFSGIITPIGRGSTIINFGINYTWIFQNPMRAAGTTQAFSIVTGASGVWHDIVGAVDRAVGTNATKKRIAVRNQVVVSANSEGKGQLTADAEL